MSIETGAGPLQIINTHLGLVPREQQAQAKELAGPRWLGGEARRDPLILVGDLNATRAASAYRILTDQLADATKQIPRRRRMATFPSRSPVLRIDHVLVSAGVCVMDARVPGGPHVRTASDHRPLVVDFELDATASPSRDPGTRIPGIRAHKCAAAAEMICAFVCALRATLPSSTSEA